MILRRIQRKLVSYFDAVASRIYNTRHPGPIARAVISFLGPIVRLCQPNDKWNLHVFVPLWLAGLQVAPLNPLPKSKSVFIYCGYRGVFTHHIVLSVMLAWRGHRITIGYLPKLQSPSKPPIVDHPTAKPYLQSIMSRIGPMTGERISCIDLSEESGSVEVDQVFVEKQARYDTVMSIQMETIDRSDPTVRSLHDHMRQIGVNAQVAIRNHFSRTRYDIAIVGNGTTYEGAHVCQILRELGQPVNGTEKFAFRGVRVINHGDNFLAGDDIGYIWDRREALGYTRKPFLSVALRQAERSIKERSQNSTETWYWELQHAVNQSDQDALAAAGIPSDKAFILICPNVVFDAGYGKITNVFPSMKEWLVETILFLLSNSSHLIVVRAHPGEGLYWAGKEPVHELLAKEGITPGDRLVIIPGPAKVNTYRLMERCLFGVVFSSSTGLEMAVMGKHVVTASNVVYANRGFTHDAERRDDYFRQLGDLSGRSDLSPVAESTQQLALLFYFVYHWVTQYPYPYDKPSGIARRPPAQLLQGKDITRFLPYLDMVVMNEGEFHDQAGRYLQADKILERLNAAPGNSNKPAEMEAAECPTR